MRETTWSQFRGRAARKKAFSFAKASSIGLEIRTVGRQKAQLRAGVFDRQAHLQLLMHGEIVEHDDIPAPQRRHQDLFDIGEEARNVDRAVEDRGRRQALEPQRCDDCVGLPVTARWPARTRGCGR